MISAGSAGAVLANRLLANPDVKVTVLEAGGWDESPFIHMPGGYFRLMQKLQLEPVYWSVPQKHINNRVMLMPRAKSVGGCKTMNRMICICRFIEPVDAKQRLALPPRKVADRLSGVMAWRCVWCPDRTTPEVFKAQTISSDVKFHRIWRKFGRIFLLHCSAARLIVAGELPIGCENINI